MAITSVGDRFTVPDVAKILYPNDTAWQKHGHKDAIASALIRDSGLHFIRIHSEPGKTTIWERIA